VGGRPPSTLYAELQVTSNFSFLRGASDPNELVLQALKLGHKAIAITDCNSVAGIVRAYVAAKETGIKLVVGVRLDFDDGPSVLCFPRDRPAYARMTTLLTTGKRRAEKGQCRLYVDDLFAQAEGQIVVALPPERVDESFANHLRRLRDRLPALYLAAHHLYRGDDVRRITELGALADSLGLGLVATNDVHYHVPARRPLQDVLTCIRESCAIHEAGTQLSANAERHLKSTDEMARLFASRPDAVARTMEIVDACRFSLADLKYEYPAEPVPEGRTPQEELERLTWEGVARRYKDRGGIPKKVRKQLADELALVAELNYPAYFLTVHDIVRYAREQKILCQGRGSAANSTICYALGITEVDPANGNLLFARFLSTEREEPPDIDVDFEHERREEVIQYIYKKYGRDRAGIAATVISYRARSALRDVGKAMGLSLDTVDVLSKAGWSWDREEDEDNGKYVREVGLDPSDPTILLTLKLANQLIGFPRHLSQHVGGFVITRSPLHELVPIENAAMEDRTVIEWDKDDLDAVGMFKIDVLALGMLSCLRRGLALLKDHYGEERTLATLPLDDEATYDMICKADTIGVFQIESRAQMSMLPRLRPREFYDLVIEVAIVRPGPIQGGMVHPYLQRREEWRKGNPPRYPSPELKEVLEKTLGIPLFQEQAMKIAIVAAGFTAAQADGLRRSMATFRRSGTIPQFREKFVAGMVGNNYSLDFAQRCFKQIEGFADYGFPESHSASFAVLVYASAWMKCHYPAVFAAALLNSQPMGFYAPAQIVRDAREHNVEVRPVDVSHSHWDCTLESAGGRMALRLGLRQVKGLGEEAAKALVARRGDGYATLRDVWRRAGLGLRALETLADADAWRSLGLDRRAALWQIRALGDAPLPLFAHAEAQVALGHNQPPVEMAQEPAVTLPAMTLGQHVVEDYRALHMSLKRHPLAFLRPLLTADDVRPHVELKSLTDGAAVTVAGLVLIRQQPGTAKGIIFLTLEDETGVANIVVWKNVFQAHRRILLDARLLLVKGRLQSQSGVIHVVAERLVDRTDDLRRISGNEDDPHDVIPAGRNFQ
jgi:error-prone DNA polymerase